MMHVGKYELAAVGSPSEHDGRLTVTVETALTIAQMAKNYNAGDITWGNAAGEELRYNQGIEAIATDAARGRATITWRVSTASPGDVEELRQGIDDSDAALVELADLYADLEARVTALENPTLGETEQETEAEDNG